MTPAVLSEDEGRRAGQGYGSERREGESRSFE
jgi:hypothetical protein